VAARTDGHWGTPKTPREKQRCTSTTHRNIQYELFNRRTLEMPTPLLGQEMDPIKRTATIYVDQEESKSTDLVDLGGVLPSSLVPGQQAN
jgi:hypothetical protein